jgi:hypothetical protein
VLHPVIASLLENRKEIFTDQVDGILDVTEKNAPWQGENGRA